MDRLRITGQQKLAGTIPIEGAKNALLLQMAASLLTTDSLVLQNVPRLADTQSMILLLEHLGAKVIQNESFLNTGTVTAGSSALKQLELKAEKLNTVTAPYHIVRKMRASIVTLGPLLARYGEAKVSMPGGCAIGIRPIDLHLKGLEALGAQLTLEEGYIQATAPKGLVGADYTFAKTSVTGTANLLMAATLAKGTTVLKGAALEPEIGDLALCLQKMGANISGVGTSTLSIEGVGSLQGAVHQTLPDRVEMGTYILAAAITGSQLFLEKARLDLLPTFKDMLETMGVTLQQRTDGVFVNSPQPKHMKKVGFETAPYPGFPTDLQAQMMALLTLVPGKSTVTETIFENRFMHIAELHRMGAAITIEHNAAHVEGVRQLKGAPLMATDIRASACLVLAALAAVGESTIQRIYHLDRGYSHLHQKLKACGAHIERLDGKEAAPAVSAEKQLSQ
ncbi:MAG: UDP-N-acetylglucosamine 1-carboxyvinyltransferase [Holosporaceae bacterium]